MTPEQHYLFDLTGYLHLEKVLEGEELHRCRRPPTAISATTAKSTTTSSSRVFRRRCWSWFSGCLRWGPDLCDSFYLVSGIQSLSRRRALAPRMRRLSSSLMAAVMILPIWQRGSMREVSEP